MAVNSKNLNKVKLEINNFNQTNLLIVSKNQSVDDIIYLLNQGFNCFGENRVQEANRKFSNLRKNYNFQLDLIGPLQTNKVPQALNLFETIQTIDRHKLVDEICKYAHSDMRTKNFYIQINIGNEMQKSGISPKDFESFYNYCINLDLKISGIMCIPPNNEDPTEYFKEMYAIKKNTNNNLQLSMGMSADYLIALKMGSNLIRIGSLIFQ